MGRRLVVTLLLSAWLIGVLGCGYGGPVEETKGLKELRPRMPLPESTAKNK
jgi:hypothetical protein